MNSPQPLALIVDDEPDLLSLLEISLRKMKIKSIKANNLTEAIEWVGKQRFDFCLTDMRLPDGNGLDLVAHIQKTTPDTPVAVITAHGSAESAVRALKSGAFDFVAKPVELPNLRSIVQAALRLSPGKNTDTEKKLLGNSEAIKKTRKLIEKVSRSQAPIYIQGESGTGKELIANLIHELGPRASSPFIAINCGAIPTELLENELFGHKKGSFTGADSDKKGLFRAATGGTVFLDEIAELPKPMQVKLLRAIQEKRIRPVGGTEEVAVDIRFISASNQDLRKLVTASQFRDDLYYRLNVIQIDAPSLRERKNDIPLIAEKILKNIALQSAQPAYQLSDAAVEKLIYYPFPGNVRELENILERSVALVERALIEADDLLLPETEFDSEELSIDTMDTPIDEYLSSIEISLIRQALNESNGNITKAAKLLGTTFRSLRYKISKYGI